MAIIKKFRIKSFKKQKPLVQLKNISLSFGKRKILDNVSFDINQGEILGMLGPNGVGKSTIFNLITGLIKPDYGSIFFDSTNATDYPIYIRPYYEGSKRFPNHSRRTRYQEGDQ